MDYDPHEAITDLLARYNPADERESLYVAQLRQFLASTDNAFDRTNLVAHIVADGWVLNKTRNKVLLVRRGESKTWLAPGGHCDGNPSLWQTAIREVQEETGVLTLKPLLNGIYDLNTHLVPFQIKKHGPEPQHLHFNVCFLFEADDNVLLKANDENDSVAWHAVSDLPTINFWQDHMQRVPKTLCLNI